MNKKINHELIEAAGRGDADLCAALIDQGANVQSVDAWGRTALHLTALHGRTQTCELLIDKGVDIHAVDDCLAHTPISRWRVSETAPLGF